MGFSLKNNKSNKELTKNIEVMKYLKNILPVIFTFLLGVSAFSQDTKIPTDKEISNAVEEELLSNSATPSYLIDVETDEGIVTLSGSVNNILARDGAIQVARMVKGVRGVIDRIKVTAPAIPDDKLETNIEEALMNDPATAVYEVSANVKNGVVTLNGMVDSWQEKQLAEYVVKGVKGVKEVLNNIVADIKTQRTDTDIERDVQKALNNDVRVDGSLIEVTVKDGRVFLTGVVGSANEKTVANSIAWTNGVISVDHSGLEVKEWSRNDDLRTNKYVIKPDKEIREAILDAFLYDPRVSSFNPDVSVNDGQVTLSGVVDNLKAKRAAEQDAKYIVGVVGVKNYIKVRPDLIPQDEKLEASIHKALVTDPMIDRWDIEVNANNGIVYLNGTADSNYEKFHAEDVVSEQKGVVGIENNLTIYNDDDFYYNDYSGWNTYTPSYQIKVTGNYKSDQQIKRDIQGQLWWSPYVNENEIDITVANGTAILDGQVETYRERKFAEINAREGGAKEIENNITVNHNVTIDK